MAETKLIQEIIIDIKNTKHVAERLCLNNLQLEVIEEIRKILVDVNESKKEEKPEEYKNMLFYLKGMKTIIDIMKVNSWKKLESLDFNQDQIVELVVKLINVYWLEK